MRVHRGGRRGAIELMKANKALDGMSDAGLSSVLDSRDRRSRAFLGPGTDGV